MTQTSGNTQYSMLFQKNLLFTLHLFSNVNSSFFKKMTFNPGTFKLQKVNLRFNHDKQGERAVLQLIMYFSTAMITDTEHMGKIECRSFC